MGVRHKNDFLSLLSGVRRVFAESHDYECTLSAIAHLVLPYLGSWCAVDVCEEDGSMRRVAVVHPDPSKDSLVRALEKGWPPEVDDPVGAPAVMRTRRTVSIPIVTETLMRRMARTPENLSALLALGIGSVITVPLMARNNVLGAITFVSDVKGHRYDADDVSLAEDLAGIAALALDNARMYRGAIGRAKEESANKVRTEVLTTMSHEIRTPLNAIIGYAELLDLGLAGPLTQKQRDYVTRLRLSGTHLAGLVNDVLDLAKADAGKLLMAGEVSSTAAAIATAIATTQHAADAAYVHIVDDAVTCSENDAGGSYVGDEKRVRQILINLVANAIKFTPRGGIISLVCGTTAEVPPGTCLVGSGPWTFIRVSDTGPGVPLDQHAAVFEPFVQAENGFTRSKGGTGLGLTISRRLARLMGGDLTLATEGSSNLAGAVFTLWLPQTDGKSRRSTDLPERAGARISRSLDSSKEYRIYGLAEIGRHLRLRIEELLTRVAARILSDDAFPSSAALSHSELEDHQLAFFADVVQSLIVIDETGGVNSLLYLGGSEIQLVVSALHGRMRHHQGWTLEHLDRESVIVHEELKSLIHNYVPEGVGDVTAALSVIEHLVEQARVESARAFRQADQRSNSVSGSWKQASARL